MTQKKLKPIPEFASEDEEREFWATHDSTEYVDWSKAVRVGPFPHLAPATKTISVRLPEPLLADLKMLAKKRDIPYQSLLKVFLHERVREELARDRETSEAKGSGSKRAAAAEGDAKGGGRRRKAG